MKREVLAEGVEIWCGDCRQIVDGLDYDSVATDPPYGMAFVSNHRAVKYDAIANDDADWPLEFAINLPARHSKYVFARWDDLQRVPKPKSCVTWVKNNWSMGDLEHEHGRQTEVALFYPGPEHYFPAGRPTDVLTVARTGNNHHPTEKPVDLMWAVVRWTAGTVLDPFCGSGSTGVAAVRQGRSFIGVEIDPAHFETALRRISDELKRPRLSLDAPPPAPKQEAFNV